MEDVIFTGSESRGAARHGRGLADLRRPTMPGGAAPVDVPGLPRDRGHPPALPRRRQRVPDQQGALPPARHHRLLPRHRRRHQGLLDHRAGPHRPDRLAQARGPPHPHRGGRGHHQVQGQEEGRPSGRWSRRGRTCCASPTSSASSRSAAARCAARRRRPSATSSYKAELRDIELWSASQRYLGLLAEEKCSRPRWQRRAGPRHDEAQSRSGRGGRRRGRAPRRDRGLDRAGGVEGRAVRASATRPSSAPSEPSTTRTRRTRSSQRARRASERSRSWPAEPQPPASRSRSSRVRSPAWTPTPRPARRRTARSTRPTTRCRRAARGDPPGPGRGHAALRPGRSPGVARLESESQAGVEPARRPRPRASGTSVDRGADGSAASLEAAPQRGDLVEERLARPRGPARGDCCPARGGTRAGRDESSRSWRRGELELDTLREEAHRRRSRLQSLGEIQIALRELPARRPRHHEQYRPQAQDTVGETRPWALERCPRPGRRHRRSRRPSSRPRSRRSSASGSGNIIVESHEVGRRRDRVPEEAQRGALELHPARVCARPRLPATRRLRRQRRARPSKRRPATAGRLAGGRGVRGPDARAHRLRPPVRRRRGLPARGRAGVDDLQKALELWRQTRTDKTIVTLDGEVIDPHGVVTGGSRESAAAGRPEQKREIRELEEVVRAHRCRPRGGPRAPCRAEAGARRGRAPTLDELSTAARQGRDWRSSRSARISIALVATATRSLRAASNRWPASDELALDPRKDRGPARRGPRGARSRPRRAPRTQKRSAADLRAETVALTDRLDP